MYELNSGLVAENVIAWDTAHEGLLQKWYSCKFLLLARFL